MRMSKVAPLRWIARIYISVMRGTPLMLQMFAIYFARTTCSASRSHPIPSGWRALWHSSSITPATLPRSIARACSRFRVVNMRPPRCWATRVCRRFLYIVMPQVAKRILPAMGNEIITLVKDTSLAFAIGVGEMFSTAKALVASQVSMVPFAIAALIYWVFNFVVEMLLAPPRKKWITTMTRSFRRSNERRTARRCARA